MLFIHSDSEEGRMIRALIVDDNVAFRQSFKETLHMLFPDLEIQEAGEGTECLRKVEVFNPEVIFMDIRLPGENGLSLTKKIKAKHPEMSVIVVTSCDNPEYRDAAVQSGASHFVSKDVLSIERISELIKPFMAGER